MSSPTAPSLGGPRVDRLGRANRSTLVGSAASAALGFALLLLLTNGLGAGDAGVVLVAVAAANIAVGASVLGTDATLVRFIASAHRAGHAGQARRLTLVGAGPVAVVGVVVAGIGVVGAEPLADLMVDGPVRADQVDSIRAAALAVPVAALSLSLLAATRGTGSMAPTVWLDQVARPAVQLAALAIVVAGSWSVVAATAAWWWPVMVPFAGAAAWLLQRLPPDDRSPIDARAFWRFSLPHAGTGLLRVMIRWVDTLVVGALLGVEAAAVYTAATRLLKLGSIVNQAVFRASAPQIAEELSVDDRDGAEAVYRTSTRWLVLATWPLYLTCLAFAPDILRVFGDEFTEGAGAVRILAAALLVASACGPVESVLVMSGRTGLNLGNNVLALGVNVGLGLVLIPHWQLEGAAVAWALSVWCTNLLPLVQVRRQLRMVPVDGVLIRTALGLVVGFIIGALAAGVVGGGGPGMIVGLVSAGTVIGPQVWRARHELALPQLLAGRPGS